MKQVKAITRVVLSLAVLAPLASASVATFGPTTQNVLITGLGGNSSGEGQVRVTLGNCVFDGTNTTCSLSAPFTGVGPGGTFSIVLTYPGNGVSPLTAVSQSPGSIFLNNFQLNIGSIVTTLTESNGTALAFNGQIFNSALYDQPGDLPAQCTVVPASECNVGQVGLIPGATINGPVSGTFDPTPVDRRGGECGELSGEELNPTGGAKFHHQRLCLEPGLSPRTRLRGESLPPTTELPGG